jgi:F-type H+-transporting ATPase subunit gamma
MTHRRELERHRHSLTEIRNIMNSMKTLAYMETRKLARFLDAQHAVVRNIEQAAADLLCFHPEILPETGKAMPVYLLIGTERGFCGDLNQALLEHLASVLQEQPEKRPLLISIGHRLHTLLLEEAGVVSRIDGASIVEEVTARLNQIVAELTTLQQKHGMLKIFCLHHSMEDGITVHQLSPPFQHLLHRRTQFPHPPALNVSPKKLLAGLTDHYLFTALHEILYSSLMAENHYRVAHLERALKHLDARSEELDRRCNALRQEEIIEEIEVILLNAVNPGNRPQI